MGLRGLDDGVAKSHRCYRTGVMVIANPIADFYGLLQFENYATYEVHQQILEGQSDDRRGYSRGSNEARNV